MDDEVKLPGSSFDEIAKIIQGYAQLDRETSLDDISKAIGMNPTVVSRNNGFLVSVGIIEGGQKKVITPLGKKLGIALSHDIEDEIRHHLKLVVEGSEFLRNLVGAVRIRKGMDESALRAHVAYSAGLGKSSGVMTGAGTIVEVLRRAGVIEERDGKFVAVLDGVSAPQPSAQDSPVRMDSPANTASVTKRATSGLTISIQIEVQCEPKDLDGLGKRLRRVIEEFEEQDNPNVEAGDKV